MTTPTTRHIGSRLELFVDYHLIDRLDHCRLKMHEPRDAGVALRFDGSWEGPFAGCLTVLQDGGLYRMYYRGMPEVRPDGSDVECTCLAESRDGVNWTKPRFGLFDYMNNSRAVNNIIVYKETPASHNFSPFLDTRPGVPDHERYKAVAGLHPGGLFIYASPDGVHWKRFHPEAVIKHDSFAFDSVNVAFWSESEGCYVVYFRTWKGLPDWSKAVRWVSRATSPDLIRWTPTQEMEAGDTTPDHLYTQGTRPYFRAPHLYIALAARFWGGKRVVTEAEAKALGVVDAYAGDCSDAVLLTSRGGNRYDRTFMESFLRPGHGASHWVSRTNYPAVGIVPTSPSELSIYCHRNYAQPTSHVGRFTIRTDGFVSVNAPWAGGSMTTHPLTFTGGSLQLNYAASAAGEVRVELQDASGAPIPGFTLADAVPTLGDRIDHPVAWKHGTDVSPLAGREVRVRFEMKDADLYSLCFR